MEIKGTIEIGGRTSEFMLLEDGGWTQWGVDQIIAGQRVDLLERLSHAYMEWADENLCKTCKENLLNDGEGYDGECGDCADKTEEGRDTDPEEGETDD